MLQLRIDMPAFPQLFAVFFDMEVGGQDIALLVAVISVELTAVFADQVIQLIRSEGTGGIARCSQCGKYVFYQ